MGGKAHYGVGVILPRWWWALCGDNPTTQVACPFQRCVYCIAVFAACYGAATGHKSDHAGSLRKAGVPGGMGPACRLTLQGGLLHGEVTAPKPDIIYTVPYPFPSSVARERMIAPWQARSGSAG
ncbi:hypothetical protein [Acetobacter okinawensis]|uniref:hypothetical protein n=1 Tax=Acetobacter okinawensis TaxID=1076594 RepID=UPI00131EF6A1|nr:hypothetical protein [Acetobacter okinawensis]